MLSGAHLHLLVNHAPVFGTFFAFALLFVSYFTSPNVLRKSAFVVLICSAIAGAVSDLSGQAAEDAVRGFPGVKRQLIHAHEQMGDKAYLLGILLGILALIALWRWRRTPVPAGAATAALFATAFVFGAFAYTALLGGQIRHTEVRPGATPADATTIEPRPQRPAPPPGAD